MPQTKEKRTFSEIFFKKVETSGKRLYNFFRLLEYWNILDVPVNPFDESDEYSNEMKSKKSRNYF